ncbi:hypothetical protein [Cyclobacterium sp.]|uniref:hypothetical protein n=1 Tax=Cyclobacterium sp. TaxID=1966343 RepID=UPI0019A30CE0|nr:hypothetical protein [Cyclobacterium sp.]MBD3628446.1 hypothetical protein [Cyclobacterium sp.]
MKKNIFYLANGISVIFISYEVVGLEFVWLFLCFVAVLFLFFVWIISYFRKVKGIWIQIPLRLIGICIIGVLASLFRPYEDSAHSLGTEREQLENAYVTDQADRKYLKSYIPFLSGLKDRDQSRLNQVKSIYERNKNLDPIEKFYAAFIFHHSADSKDYKIASKLASEAAKARHLQNHYLVHWLKKAAYDRWMVSMGKPEKYNTQNKFSIEID